MTKPFKPFLWLSLNIRFYSSRSNRICKVPINIRHQVFVGVFFASSLSWGSYSCQSMLVYPCYELLSCFFRLTRCFVYRYICGFGLMQWVVQICMTTWKLICIQICITHSWQLIRLKKQCGWSFHSHCGLRLFIAKVSGLNCCQLKWGANTKWMSM